MTEDLTYSLHRVFLREDHFDLLCSIAERTGVDYSQVLTDLLDDWMDWVARTDE